MWRAGVGGPVALRTRPSPGARHRLCAEQFAHMPALLHRGSGACGFCGQLWTRGRIAALIHLELGISDHPHHVGRLC
jgi:hypothetical protein